VCPSLGPYLVIFSFKKLISALEDMKTKKNTFSTLVYKLIFQSIAKKIESPKNPKIDFPKCPALRLIVQ
jgi:hypothetical protein